MIKGSFFPDRYENMLFNDLRSGDLTHQLTFLLETAS